MATKHSLRIYTVVDVMSGVAVGVKHFMDPRDAKRRLKRLLKGRDLNEDDVQLFETTVKHADRAAVGPGH